MTTPSPAPSARQVRDAHPEADPADRDSLLDSANSAWQLAHDRLVGRLFVPPEAGDVPIVAVEDAGL